MVIYEQAFGRDEATLRDASPMHWIMTTAA